MSREHVLFDALWMGGRIVAWVEAFEDDGPWYANAITPQGECRRIGAGISLVSSVQWAEVVAGYRIAAPQEHGPGRSKE